MKTVAQYEKAAYLSRRASGACYDYPAALSQLAEHMDVPVRQIKKLIADGALPVRNVMFDDRWQRTIMSESVVAMIEAVGAGKKGNARRLVKGARRSIQDR